MTRVLIIGQGIAGSVLAGTLIDAGIDVYVADQVRENSSSRVAAGLFNPITGKRLSLTWEALNSWQALYSFYPSWENKLGAHFFHEKTVFRVLQGQDQLNDWSARSAEWPYSWFLDETPLRHLSLGSAECTGLMIRKSGWLDTQHFLDSMQAYLKHKDCLYQGYCGMEAVHFEDDGSAVFAGMHFSHVIHSGGWLLEDQWVAGQLPFTPMRGEIIDVFLEGFEENYILVKNHFMLPLGAGRYRIGSTYDWRITEAITTQEGLKMLMDFASEIMGSKPELLAHRAGVRPAVKDRRPLVGKIKGDRNFYVFNGFGSKAVSLAPWLAQRFTEYLINGTELPAEAHLKRFNPIAL